MTPEKLAQGISGLVSLPRAYYRISEMLEDPRYGSADIGKVIAHDPALTARLLRLVNSAHYGLTAKIATIPQAITLLGTRTLHELVLATSVTSAFSKISTRLVDMADFWHHSIYCGLLARAIARHRKHAQPEQVFVAGLIHDLGRLVIYHSLPEQSADILNRSTESAQPMFRIEREVLGFDHAAVGAALLAAWQLPEIFRTVVAYHHMPIQARVFSDEVAFVHIANVLSKKVEPGYKIKRPGDSQATIDSVVADRVPLDSEMLDQFRLEADVQSIEVFSTLFSGTPMAS